MDLKTTSHYCGLSLVKDPSLMATASVVSMSTGDPAYPMASPGSLNMNMNVTVGTAAPAGVAKGGPCGGLGGDTDDFLKTSNNRFTDLLSSVLSPDEDEDVVTAATSEDFGAASTCGPVDLSALDGLHLDFPMNSNSSPFNHSFTGTSNLILKYMAGML